MVSSIVFLASLVSANGFLSTTNRNQMSIMKEGSPMRRMASLAAACRGFGNEKKGKSEKSQKGDFYIRTLASPEEKFWVQTKGEPVGEGSFGVVHKVYRKGDKNPYGVIKVHKKKMDRQRHLEEREMEILQKLKGVGGVVTLLAKDESSGSLVFEALGAEVNSVRTPKTNDEHGWLLLRILVNTMVYEVVDTLQVVHRTHGVVNKDIKLENILFNLNHQKDERAPLYKIIDWGTAEEYEGQDKLCYESGTHEYWPYRRLREDGFLEKNIPARYNDDLEATFFTAALMLTNGDKGVIPKERKREDIYGKPAHTWCVLTQQDTTNEFFKDNGDCVYMVKQIYTGTTPVTDGLQATYENIKNRMEQSLVTDLEKLSAAFKEDLGFNLANKAKIDFASWTWTKKKALLDAYQLKYTSSEG